MYLGIDYSINSPGICLLTDDQRLEFITLARTNVASQKFFELLSSYNVHVRLSKPLQHHFTTIDSSRETTLDAMLLAQRCIESIININQGRGDREKNIVAIEGFSYNSLSNRITQLAGYHYVLRMQCLAYLISPLKIENLWIFAPNSVKSTAGSAGRGKKKKDMVKAFIEDSKPLPGLIHHPFYQEISKYPETFQTKRGNWVKPIDDLVDAYWVLKTFFLKTQ